MLIPNKLFFVCLSAGALTGVLSAQSLISDTFATSFGNFTVQAGGIADGFSHVPTAGVGAISGRVDAVGTGNHTDAVYYSGTGAAVTWSTATTYETSIFFYQGTVTDGQIYQVMSGFLRSTGSNFAGGG